MRYESLHALSSCSVRLSRRTSRLPQPILPDGEGPVREHRSCKKRRPVSIPCRRKKMTTDWRPGRTCGNTRSMRWAAVSAIRRVVHDGHTPRPLQEKATRKSWPQDHSTHGRSHRRGSRTRGSRAARLDVVRERRTFGIGFAPACHQVSRCCCTSRSSAVRSGRRRRYRSPQESTAFGRKRHGPVGGVFLTSEEQKGRSLQQRHQQ